MLKIVSVNHVGCRILVTTHDVEITIYYKRYENFAYVQNGFL